MRREDRMRAVVDAIASYRAERGYAPSVRDVQERTGFSSTAVVAYWLRECELGGLLVREPYAHRAITLTAAGWALAGSFEEQASRGAGASAPGGRAA